MSNAETLWEGDDMCRDEISSCLCLFQVLSGALVIVGIVITAAVDYKLGLYILLGVLPFSYLCHCCSEIYVSSLLSTNPNPTICCTCITHLLATVGGILAVLALLRAAYKKDNRVDFNSTNPTLTQFDLINNLTTLNYNLSLNVAVGPNLKGAGVCFEKLRAWGYYQGNKFTSLSLPPFYLEGNKNHGFNSSSVVLESLVFQGQQDGIVLAGDGLKRYQNEAAARLFTIDVTLSYSGFRTHNISDCNQSDTNGSLVNKASTVGHELKGLASLELKRVPLTFHNATG